MGLNEAILSRQLERAKEDLSACGKALEAQGVATTQRRKNAKWRHLNAQYNTIRVRLKAVEGVKSRNEDAAKRKAEKIAAAAQEKAEPKKAAKAPKAAAKGGGGGKKEKSSEPKEKKPKKEEKKEA